MVAKQNRLDGPPLRFAVVGLGYIAQVAVLPAFQHCKAAARLVALVSDDPTKRRVLGRKYGVGHQFDYDDFDECLESGEIDAVYIALPNHLHAEYTIRAAEAGIHVLCEKPMAVNEGECNDMIAACLRNNVRLMIAYRLHFDQANLEAVQIAAGGTLGEVRMFNSVFSMNVTDRDNIRLDAAAGGGTLLDLGIYCINAARYIFRAEPIEVFAFASDRADRRFDEVDEMTGAIMRFPGGRLATFTSSFGATDVSHYRVVGTKGDLVVEPAFDYAVPLKHVLTRGGRTTRRTFPKRDQFAAEFIHFWQCVRSHRDPQPGGSEGMADVRIIEALLESGRTGRPVGLADFPRLSRPTPKLEIRRPPARKPRLVHATEPSK